MQLPKKILPLQAQNAHNILLNKLFNAHKKKNIRHNRNRKPIKIEDLPALSTSGSIFTIQWHTN